MSGSQVPATVIMTSYNHAQHVSMAVDSVLSQGFADFELIVVDDGSTDSSVEILQTYRDPRIKLIAQDNKGQAAAINRAYKESRGQIIALIDSDDWWKRDKLQAVVDTHKKLKGRYGVLQHNLMVVNGARQYPYKKELLSGNIFETMRLTGQINFFVTTTGLSFNREFFNRLLPIPEALRISPDAYLTRAALIFGPLYSLSDFLGYLRIHSKNSGMNQRKDFHRELRRKVIYPALNRFYALQGIDYRFGDWNEKSFSHSRGVLDRARIFLKKLKFGGNETT